jgi:hypothetical protein
MKVEKFQEKRLKKIILGLIQKGNEEMVKEFMDSFGLSHNSLSREFIKQNAQIFKEFRKINLSNYDYNSKM